jgi:hypothetical protein
MPWKRHFARIELSGTNEPRTTLPLGYTCSLSCVNVCMYVCEPGTFPGWIVTLFITIGATLFGVDTCLRVRPITSTRKDPGEPAIALAISGSPFLQYILTSYSTARTHLSGVGFKSTTFGGGIHSLLEWTQCILCTTGSQ